MFKSSTMHSYLYPTCTQIDNLFLADFHRFSKPLFYFRPFYTKLFRAHTLYQGGGGVKMYANFHFS